MIWQWEKDVQLPCVLSMWVLWSTRNDTNVGEAQPQPSVTAELIQRYFTEYSEFYRKQIQLAPVVRHWSKLQENWLKINADDAFNLSTRQGGWGFVIRDHHGAVVGSGAGTFVHCTDALHAEAIAAMEALSFASGAEMNQVELEVDALNLR